MEQNEIQIERTVVLPQNGESATIQVHLVLTKEEIERVIAPVVAAFLAKTVSNYRGVRWREAHEQ